MNYEVTININALQLVVINLLKQLFLIFAKKVR